MNPVILLDVDGPLANFTQAYLDELYEVTGHRHVLAEIRQFHIHKSAFFEKRAQDYKERTGYSLKDTLAARVTRAGFCENIAVQDGAQEAVEKLKSIGEVWVVTSPWDSSPTWMYERLHWVHRHFGIPRAHVIQVGRKVRVHGDVFVDDRPEHCIEWQKQWPKGVAQLFGMHHNEDAAKQLGIAPSTWDDIIRVASS